MPPDYWVEGGKVRGLRNVSISVAALLLPLTLGHADPPQDPPPPQCALASCYDPMFTLQYPHSSSFVTSTNVRIPLPAHYFEAEAAILFGTGDLATMEAWSAGFGLKPIRTEGGSGVGLLVLAHYIDSDLGPYYEAITAFPVNEDVVTIPDDAGAMLAAALDPTNQLWTRGLILDQRLPIDAGREYLFIPKEIETKRMSIDIAPLTGDVTFDFAESDGTPIASGQFVMDPATTMEPAADLATQDATHRVLMDVLRRGAARLRLVFSNIEDPDILATMTVVTRPVDLTSVRASSCCEGSSVSFNAATSYGGDLAALQFQPTLVVSMKGLRLVLDINLDP